MAEASSSNAPPSYSPTLSTVSAPGSSSAQTHSAHDNGFPGGYFLIKSVATGKVLDVARGENDDGTDVILWNEKETSLVEVMRSPDADNQLFFLDYTGTLCSKVCGLPVDIEDNKLVVRRHRPMTFPFPNAYSHPWPRFTYDRTTGLIRIQYRCDPSYPSPSAYPSQAWKERDYILTSVPLRRPKSLLETTADFFATATSKVHLPFNPFGGPAAALTAAHVSTGEFDLREEEVMEEERGENEHDDDSPEKMRNVQVITLPIGWSEKEKDTRAMERRRWQIVEVLANRNVTRTGSMRA